MNPQPGSNPFESNDQCSELNNQITSCNLSSSSTHSSTQSSKGLPSSTSTRRLIHSSFIELKKSLGLTQFQRKTQIDSLLKKSKSKAFKAIHEGIKQCFLIKVPRLPQEFITNIKIDFNKKYLNKSIMAIYQENGIFTSLEEMKAKGQIKENKQWALEEFLMLPLRNVFDYYVNSTKFISDFRHIIQREGEKFALLFYFISNVFIKYYTQTKGNRPKCLKHKEPLEGCGKGVDSRDIFIIEKRERERENVGGGSAKEALVYNRHYLLPGSEPFAPVFIITNEELV